MWGNRLRKDRWLRDHISMLGPRRTTSHRNPSSLRSNIHPSPSRDISSPGRRGWASMGGRQPTPPGASALSPSSYSATGNDALSKAHLASLAGEGVVIASDHPDGPLPIALATG